MIDAGARVTGKKRQIDAAPITPGEGDANLSLYKLDIHVYRSGDQRRSVVMKMHHWIS